MTVTTSKLFIIFYLLLFTSCNSTNAIQNNSQKQCQTNSYKNSCYKQANAIYKKLWNKIQKSKKQQKQVEYVRELFFRECSLGPSNQWFEASCYWLFFIRNPESYSRAKLKEVFGFKLIASYHLDIDGPGHGFRHSFVSEINDKCYLWEPGYFSEIDCKDSNPFVEFEENGFQ
ncbi:MAG: hypothetical protein ABUK01_09470 [Leptospirales bacterium]